MRVKLIYNIQVINDFLWPQAVFPTLIQKLLTFFFTKLGLKQINIDYIIFILKTSLNKFELSSFVDNIKIIISEKSKMIKQLKVKLVSAFSMINIRSISFYFGLKVE